MASRTEKELDLRNTENAEAWIRQFSAICRTKKIKDEENEFAITDLFLAKAGIEAIKKLSLMAAPIELEKMTFNQIKELITKTMKPKERLIIGERTMFLGLKQNNNECIIEYYQRLRLTAKTCNFEKIGDDMSKEDEMILMRMIEGLINNDHKKRILEMLQANKMSLEEVINALQQLELIKSHCNVDFQHESSMHSVYDKNKTQQNSKCQYCGGKHEKGKCPAFGKECKNCRKRNHFEKVCRYKRTHNHNASINENEYKSDESNAEDNLSTNSITTSSRKETIRDIFSVGNENHRLFKYVTMEHKAFSMQVDTGADISIIPSNFWRRMGSPKVRKSNKTLRNFDGSIMKTLGETDILMEIDGKYRISTVVIVDVVKAFGLLGTDIINLNGEDITITEVHNSTNQETKIGCLKGFEARIRTLDDVKPSFYESRPVPIQMRDTVAKEIQRLVDEDILEPVEAGGCEWASPIVVVPKTNGVRICADFKIGVNHKICNDYYPIPEIESVFSKVSGCEVFAKLDLSNAYYQITLEEKSRNITTITTPIGLFRYKRLPMGLKSSSSIFQKAMENTLAEFDKIIIYQDDILIGGDNQSHLDDRVKRVLEVLKNKGMTLNLSKSILKSDKISFLGYQIDKGGITPDPTLVNKILSVKKPQDRKELQSFLGLANFFGRFIKNFSGIIEPLNELRQQNTRFEWGKKHDIAFQQLKNQLSSKPVIQPFDVKKETTLVTDASEKSIGGVIMQNEHPIIYMSRKLNCSEQNYSNTEREALAIVWCMNRAKQFLLGSKFQLKSDHRALEFLFHPRKPLPKVSSARLIRWAINIMAFDFDIEYVNGHKIPHADALSRLRFEIEEDIEKSEEHIIHWSGESVIPYEDIKTRTNEDRLLIGIMSRIRTGKWGSCSQMERPFKMNRHKLTIQNEIVYMDDKVIIPQYLREQALKMAHDHTHPGIIATRNKLMLNVWWPGYCHDVENYISKCDSCSKVGKTKNQTIHTWPSENAPWIRIHMDHGYLPNVGYFLVVIDSYSAWPEVIRAKDRSAASVIGILRSIFSRLGVPKVIVSDNAAEYHDESLRNWLMKIGCRMIKTPPMHPQSNGLAERMVETIKSASRLWENQNESFDSFKDKLLLNYRSIPHGNRCKSPSSLMGRQIRNPITMTYAVESPIWFRATPRDNPVEATYIAQKGNNTIFIKRGGRTVLAHSDQISRRTGFNVEDRESEEERPDHLGGNDLQTQEMKGPNPTEDSDQTIAEGVEIRRRDRYPVRASRGVPPERFGFEGGM